MTQDEIIEMVKQAGGAAGKPTPTAQVVIFTQHLDIRLFAHLVAAKEREACAKLVDNIELQCIAKDVDDPPLESVANAIRARGQA